MSKIIAFYLNQDTDHRGRFLSEIWQFDRFRQELIHDYIQWLFPLDIPNKFGKPVLCQQDCQQFSKNPQLTENLLKSFDFMLNFWGIERLDTQFYAVKDLNKRTHYWVKTSDHNQLRISRVIRSLYICGQPELAFAFQAFVLKVGKEFQVNEETLTFWENAHSPFQEPT